MFRTGRNSVKPIEEIEPIEVSCGFIIWVDRLGKTRREVWRGSYHRWFNSYAEAHEYMIGKEVINVTRLTQELESAQERLKVLQELADGPANT